MIAPHEGRPGVSGFLGQLHDAPHILSKFLVDTCDITGGARMVVLTTEAGSYVTTTGATSLSTHALADRLIIIMLASTSPFRSCSLAAAAARTERLSVRRKTMPAAEHNRAACSETPVSDAAQGAEVLRA